MGNAIAGPPKEVTDCFRPSTLVATGEWATIPKNQNYFVTGSRELMWCIYLWKVQHHVKVEPRIHQDVHTSTPLVVKR
jgi:hypothetical protein